MEKLDDLVLEDAAGGASEGTVVVTVHIEWRGTAAENVNQVSSLKLTLRDPDGPAYAYLNAGNQWKANFRVRKGVNFDCWIDFSAYKFITHWEYDWNPRTCQFVYYVS